ncbi:hypothetical protein AB0Y04_02555 [Loigolactobacillus coryniformis]|uniref:Uncharacterized protein n=1 Tax=Loigolactobacillus coryniformis subsp. torquens DSM 20004 = KCTC 3535 TaxID=1423822 RepID=A0A2D1KMN2_9LACO|nr:hypothetical protein [Loigolactobacillus coryniformis]ATO43389.1 hypothetical protein LC20004_05470 [Loigolactobacillus coryniformis subsp. torquens DSM 20004 = KCTC 3535]KRK85491.1 hypothetical protein FC16_GL001445 [Loigolactobacillus coryniformis subsp. torquens DSM 20004 = KCTC 3535]MCL5457596.1 hypothetical protein [Loigolactobacillus coryniformis]MDN5953907.1 hypothetical protein [Loigolactobacillus coryniformis]
MEELFENVTEDLSKAYQHGIEERLYSQLIAASQLGKTSLSINTEVPNATIVAFLESKGLTCTHLPGQLVIDWSSIIEGIPYAG